MASLLTKAATVLARATSGMTLSKLNADLGARKIVSGCCIMSEGMFKDFPAETGRLGYDPIPKHPAGTQWILDLPSALKLVATCKGNTPLLWDKLGLSKNSAPPSATYLCVINPVALWGLREATRDMPGANAQFTGTGYTSGGLREMVINQLPITMAMIASDGDFFVQKYVSPVRIDDPNLEGTVERALLALEQVTSTPPRQ